MVIYKNTFDNVKTMNTNFPVEDVFYASNNEAIIADGITRDPIGIKDFNEASPREFIMNYPRPSGGELAAKVICECFENSKGSLLERLIKCNEAIKELNDKYIINCDYLENDYYGAVACAVNIEDSYLNYAFICDCGVIVYSKDGIIKFQTEDEKELYTDPYINTNGIPWNIPDARVIVRRDYRNNPNNMVDDKCVSYGALTGEEKVLNFIRNGKTKIDDDDIIIIYSDGMKEYLHLDDFIKLIVNFDKNKLEEFINNKAINDYEKYGKEKTLIIMKKK